MKPRFLVFLFIFISITVLGQKPEYAASLIADSLKQNANAVVRLSRMEITIVSQKAMILKSTQVTTVLNELGLNSLNLGDYYGKNRKINKIEATAYDASGKELKVYKRKDFKEQSATESGTIFSDTRLVDLDYTPTTYPFTMLVETEVETSNTAFIPYWSPSDGYLVSTENTSMTINFKPELPIRKKEVNFSPSFPIEKKESSNTINYTSKNLIARKREELSPGFTGVFPIIYFALENFQLENVEGSATNWREFGKWYYDSLLADTEEIPEETQTKIRQLVGNEKNPIEIAKIIYRYVQEKTRYVSIQVGLGGWKPMLAKEVDKLGYGDCKALTNYTRSLLKSVGVPSYFTLVYSGANEKNDLQSDFASVQGNHAILTLPIGEKLVWLECTSQVQPFGFQGDFTDDRNVLMVKPDGGEIVKTQTYSETDNLKTVKGFYQVTEDGDLTGKVNIVSKGLKYDNEFGKERLTHENQIKYYKEEFNTINNLSIVKINFKNNPNTIEFTEDLELVAEGYAQNSNGKLMFALNAFDQDSYVPKKYRTREFPFQIQRGYTNEDEIEILLPDGFLVEAKPTGIELNSDYGSYKIEFTAIAPNKIVCKRKLIIKKGLYDKSKYEEYRKFRETIAKNDNSKIVITKAK